MAVKSVEPLIGKELLARVKEMGGLTKREMARECGYFSFTKDGETRVNLSEFYDALLTAKGIQLESEKEKDRDGRGRDATYRATVHKNGQIVIGASYTQEMGLKPGDEFQIKLGYKHIHLVKLGDETDQADTSA
jgi:AbrB family looped-hinge helix DNA binding protein